MKVATYLMCNGFHVHLPVRRWVEDRSKRENFADYGDLFAGKLVADKRIEVKQNKKLEYEYGEWPFPLALICSKESFDNAVNVNKRPDYYYLVHQSLEFASLVDVQTTFPDWKVISVTDKERKYTYDCYCVEKEYLAWRYLNDRSGM